MKKALVLVLALAMVLGLATTAFASDNSGGQPAEEVAAEQTEQSDDAEAVEVTDEAAAPEEVAEEPAAEESAAEVEAVAETEGKYAGVSSEIMTVIEGLDDGPDYAEGELLVIYEDVESAECATITMCANGEEAVQTCGDETVKVTFDENEISMEDKIIELSKEENVKYVQPNYIYYMIESVDSAEVCEEMAELLSVSTDDPYLIYGQQPYLDQVNISGAWSRVLGTTYSNVTVAILDSGANVSHEDLTDSINKNKCVDVTGDTPEITDYDGDWSSNHGTQVSSMIGATTNNSKGMAGAATCGLKENCPLEYFTVDVFYGSYGYSEDIAKGIQYAMDNGAKVINMSLGYEANEANWTDYVFKNAIDAAWSQDVICVCAGGNNYNSAYQYPSDYERVISVAALDTISYDSGTQTVTGKSQSEYARADFSCYNSRKDICAPGVYNLGANGDSSKYVFMSGTSQATPVVTSVIALMCMVNPQLTFAQVYEIITSTATDIKYTKQSKYVTGFDSQGNPIWGEEFTENATVGYDIYTGYGLIDADACVAAVLSEHVLEHHARWEATFTEAGHKEYWYCTECNKYFSDAAGNNETTWDALVIPKMTKPDVTVVFDDVPGNKWFADPVAFVYARGIMTGMGGTKHFAPYDKLHREQLAVMLWRLEGSPTFSYEYIFPDVPSGKWYTDAILWAYNNNIITGYQSGYFGVGDNITREQLAVMLYRYAANYKHLDVSCKADISSYKDASKVSSWAQDAIKWAVGAGIITGKDEGTKIDPQGNATRCECAAMFQRFMNKYGL